ncbi:MAG: L,D-transpeptidase [Pseudomonadota bacterium]
MSLRNVATTLAAVTLVVACAATPNIEKRTNVTKATATKRVGPYKQCFWDYENGLPRFRNSALDAEFDSRFDPGITVSRRGLTARVVGVFSATDLAPFGATVQDLARVYPYIVPIQFVAEHRVRAEDISQSAAVRAQNPAGETVATEVTRWPENAAMIVYPVSIAAEGYNTVAGQWHVVAKARGAYSNSAGSFGLFPFIKYTSRGHALHGPITGDAVADEWYLRRGKVSHGCNRMDGEHVIELSVLLGCPVVGDPSACPVGNERVTVIEDFDVIPDPRRSDHVVGPINDVADLAQRFVVPDVAGYPRDASFPLPAEWQRSSDTSSVWLLKTELQASAGALKKAWAPVLEFATWDNRVTSTTDGFPRVLGRNCR